MTLPVGIDHAALLAKELKRLVGRVVHEHDQVILDNEHPILEWLAGDDDLGLGNVGRQVGRVGDVVLVSRAADFRRPAARDEET
jgi:hypothetical protein